MIVVLILRLKPVLLARRGGRSGSNKTGFNFFYLNIRGKLSIIHDVHDFHGLEPVLIQ